MKNLLFGLTIFLIVLGSFSLLVKQSKIIVVPRHDPITIGERFSFENDCAELPIAENPIAKNSIQIDKELKADKLLPGTVIRLGQELAFEPNTREIGGTYNKKLAFFILVPINAPDSKNKRIIPKDTKLTVLSATSIKMFFNGKITLDGKDVIIQAQTQEGFKISIMVVAGENLNIVSVPVFGRSGGYIAYSGISLHAPTIRELEPIFEVIELGVPKVIR